MIYPKEDKLKSAPVSLHLDQIFPGAFFSYCAYEENEKDDKK